LKDDVYQFEKFYYVKTIYSFVGKKIINIERKKAHFGEQKKDRGILQAVGVLRDEEYFSLFLYFAFEK
jgi:hypothetical protein